MSGPFCSELTLCSDFLMNSTDEQTWHRSWFLPLLELPLGWATPVPVTAFPGRSGCKLERFDRARFFSASGMSLRQGDKLFEFDAASISAESLDYLRSCLRPHHLVIGYELSAATRQVLNRAEITYVDIWLHPVRFYDDVLFGMSSNSPSVRENLAPYCLDERLLHQRAREIQISLRRGAIKKAYALDPNSALFVGQTLYDKALLRQGKMLSLLDFSDEFRALGERFDTVYYSRHPMVHAGDERIIQFLKGCPFAKLTKAPTYHLLAQEQIESVVAISSSVTYEAKFFGKAYRS